MSGFMVNQTDFPAHHMGVQRGSPLGYFRDGFDCQMLSSVCMKLERPAGTYCIQTALKVSYSVLTDLQAFARLVQILHFHT